MHLDLSLCRGGALAVFLGRDTRVACLALAGKSEAGLTPRWPRWWREAPLHCWRHGAPGPSCLTPSSRVSPPISSQKKSPETSVWSPRAGLSPGCDSAPSGCLPRSGVVCVWGGSGVGDHLAWECCFTPLVPGPAPSRKLSTPTRSVRLLPTVRGPSRMLKALPLCLSPPKRNTARSVGRSDCWLLVQPARLHIVQPVLEIKQNPGATAVPDKTLHKIPSEPGPPLCFH